MVWTNLVVNRYQNYLNGQCSITSVVIVTAATIRLCFISSHKSILRCNYKRIATCPIIIKYEDDLVINF